MLPFDFSSRARASEWMDDFTITDERLREALRDIRLTNRLLGGYAASDRVLTPVFSDRDRLSILDLGCGGGDYVPHLVEQGRRFGCEVWVTGLDANPVTVGHARAYLDRVLPSSLRHRAVVEVGDALDSSYDANSFDVTHASLFLHHLYGKEARTLLREMNRLSREGLVINDLHRHPLAYAGFWIVSRLLRMAPMVQHDGPISVTRGFRRDELHALASRAGLDAPTIRWHWPFRWTVSTVPALNWDARGGR